MRADESQSIPEEDEVGRQPRRSHEIRVVARGQVCIGTDIEVATQRFGTEANLTVSVQIGRLVVVEIAVHAEDPIEPFGVAAGNQARVEARGQVVRQGHPRIRRDEPVG